MIREVLAVVHARWFRYSSRCQMQIRANSYLDNENVKVENDPVYALWVLVTKSSHLTPVNLLDPNGIQKKLPREAVCVQLDDPQRNLPPSLPLLTSNFLLLQTVYRQIFYAFHLGPQRLSPLFCKSRATVPQRVPTRCQGIKFPANKVYNLDYIEVWEVFASIDKLYCCGACGSNDVKRNTSFRDYGAFWVRVDEGEFGEPWTRGHIT